SSVRARLLLSEREPINQSPATNRLRKKALALRKSLSTRLTVTPSSSATSGTVNPPKKRSSTMRACRSCSAASCSRTSWTVGPFLTHQTRGHAAQLLVDHFDELVLGAAVARADLAQDGRHLVSLGGGHCVVSADPRNWRSSHHFRTAGTEVQGGYPAERPCS